MAAKPVKSLAETLYHAGHNITADNYFTDFALASELLQNPSKSNIIIVPPKINRSVDDSIIVTINSTPVAMVRKAKYLGIIIDNKLMFGPHIAHLEVKLSRSVGILSYLNIFYLRPYFQNSIMHFFIHIYYMDLSYGSTHTKLIPTKLLH